MTSRTKKIHLAQIVLFLGEKDVLYEFMNESLCWPFKYSNEGPDHVCSIIHTIHICNEY